MYTFWSFGFSSGGAGELPAMEELFPQSFSSDTLKEQQNVTPLHNKIYLVGQKAKVRKFKGAQIRLRGNGNLRFVFQLSFSFSRGLDQLS